MRSKKVWATLALLVSFTWAEMAMAAAPPINIHPIRSANKTASLYSTSLSTVALIAPKGYTIKAVHSATLQVETEQRKATTQVVKGKWQTQFPLALVVDVQARYAVTLLNTSTKKELKYTFEHSFTGTDISEQQGVYLTFPK